MSRAALTRLWRAGVDAVGGRAAVTAHLEDVPRPDRIAAVGKAAAAMAEGALARFPGTPTLVVTKHGHGPAPEGARLLEAPHPLPGPESLIAGAALLEFISESRAPLLLVSGGASALAESLAPGVTLATLQAETARLLATGADIHALNAVRAKLSRIKGGGLLRAAKGPAAVLALSDVEGDALAVIGSGLGLPRAEDMARIVASNAHARAAVEAAYEGAVICNEETLYGPVETVAARLGAALRAGPPGLYIWGGEPVVTLPEDPGRGGRNQALALHLSREIAGMAGVTALAAGTDGTDGPTEDAGGFADGALWSDLATGALARADAGTYLAAHSALFRSGPTGTNVMDLCLALKTSA